MTNESSVSAGRPVELLTVIVVNYFTKSLTIKAVAEFLGKVRVVIVDNSQNSAESSWLQQNIPAADIIISEKNLGFGAGVNLGLSEVTTPYALVLNPDSIMGFAAAIHMIDHCSAYRIDIASPSILDGQNGGIWYAGGRINKRTMSAVHEQMGRPPKRAGIEETEFVSGCITLFGPRVLKHQELYDPSLFMYWEDVDLSLRARNKGWRLAVDHCAQAIHDEGGSTATGRAGRSSLFHYYQARNRVVVGSKHFGRRPVILGTPEYTLRVLKSILQNDSRKVRNMRALFEGTVRGMVLEWRGNVGSSISAAPSTLRIWNDLRTFHCELLREIGGLAVYQKASYDFDNALMQDVEVEKLGTLATSIKILQSRDNTIELNEPLTVGLWPKLLTYVFAIRLARALGRGPRTVTTYAIENADVVRSLQSFLARKRLSFVPAASLARLFSSLIMRSIDKIVFGTDGAYAVYREMNLLSVHQPLQIRTVQQLPNPCACLQAQSGIEAERKFDLCFVGSFEERKGIRETLRLFSDLEQRSELPLRFNIVGQGPLEETVRSWCERRDNVSLQINPPRSAIHEALRQSRVLVLLSQRKDTWREQVGLPILEGLAHGCRIISTSETGLADWLRTNGHLVFPVAVTLDVTEAAHAFIHAQSPTTNQVLASLPEKHGRISAAQWLDGGDDA